MAGDNFSFNTVAKTIFKQNSVNKTSDFGTVVGGQYNATLPTITDGAFAHFQVDSSGRLLVKIDGATLDLGGGDFEVNVSAFQNEAGVSKDAKVNANDILVIQTGSGADASGMGDEIATESTATAISGKLTTIDADTSILAAVDYATQTTLALMNAKFVTGTVIGDVNAIQSGTWDVVSNSENIATETTLALIKTAVESLDGYYTTIFDADADETAQAIKASSGTLVRLTVDNADTAKIYVQLFDLAIGDVTVGTTVPKYVIPVPAGAMYDDKLVMDFATAISYAVTSTPTGLGATGATITLSAGFK